MILLITEDILYLSYIFELLNFHLICFTLLGQFPFMHLLYPILILLLHTLPSALILLNTFLILVNNLSFISFRFLNLLFKFIICHFQLSFIWLLNLLYFSLVLLFEIVYIFLLISCLILLKICLLWLFNRNCFLLKTDAILLSVFRPHLCARSEIQKSCRFRILS